MEREQRVLRVGEDGDCQFRTVQQAIDAVPFGNMVRTIIVVYPGVYKDPVYVAKTKNFITLRGFCPEVTIISWKDTAANINDHKGSQTIGTGTFACDRFIVEGGGFTAENITFENAAPQGSQQAVAMTVTGDHCAFYNCRFLDWQSVENLSTVDVKHGVKDESSDKSEISKLSEISEPPQCYSLHLPDNLSAVKVSSLMYTYSGTAILALCPNGVHKLWKWQHDDRNPYGEATVSIPPRLWKPPNRRAVLMINEVVNINPEEAVSCFALSKNESYLISSSGGKVALFNMMTFRTIATFMPPPPAATCLALYPQDNNILAIGMEDSTVQMYNIRVDELKSKLKGHQKRITGLAFSKSLNVLVSSGADAQLCIWSTDCWDKLANKFLEIPSGRVTSPLAETRVQFHQNQRHFLAVHETQIAIYDATTLERISQWVARESGAPITHATYSSDSQLIYTSFADGFVGMFNASMLKPSCWLSPTAYLPPNIRDRSNNVYPLVIAAHPLKPHQFAMGLTDGGVHVLEPLESQGKWDCPPAPDNGSACTATGTVQYLANQLSETLVMGSE